MNHHEHARIGNGFGEQPKGLNIYCSYLVIKCDIMVEPTIQGYTFLTNVVPTIPFDSRNCFEIRITPYTDGEIAQLYATRLGVTVDKIMVEPSKVGDYLRTVYKKN